jgi:hypothetical protein
MSTHDEDDETTQSQSHHYENQHCCHCVADVDVVGTLLLAPKFCFGEGTCR